MVIAIFRRMRGAQRYPSPADSGTALEEKGARLDFSVLASRAVVLFVLLAAIAGCASAPTENFYTLSTTAIPEPAVTAKASSDFAIVVDTASVPELVDRPQFVLTISDSRVSILEQQRWAEPLNAQISRAVAANLGRLLGTTRVATTSQAGGGDADWRVTLDVQRFEARPGDAVAIDVVWAVRRGAPTTTRNGRSTAREKIGAGGYDALVSACNRALATISREIAAAM